MTEDEKKLIQARHRLEAVQARNRAHLLTTGKPAVVCAPSAEGRDC